MDGYPKILRQKAMQRRLWYVFWPHMNSMNVSAKTGAFSCVFISIRVPDQRDLGLYSYGRCLYLRRLNFWEVSRLSIHKLRIHHVYPGSLSPNLQVVDSTQMEYASVVKSKVSAHCSLVAIIVHFLESPFLYD